MAKNEDRLTQIDNEIYDIYRDAYDRTPVGKIVRLQPDTGRLGALWREWDSLVGGSDG